MRIICLFQLLMMLICSVAIAEDKEAIRLDDEKTIEQLWITIRESKSQFIEKFSKVSSQTQKTFLSGLNENKKDEADAKSIFHLVVIAVQKKQPVNSDVISACLVEIEKHPEYVDEKLLPLLFQFCDSCNGQQVVAQALRVISMHAHLRPKTENNGSVTFYFKYVPPQAKLVDMLKSDNMGMRMAALQTLEVNSKTKDFGESLGDEIITALSAIYFEKNINVRMKGIVLVLLEKTQKWDIVVPLANDALKTHPELKFISNLILNEARQSSKNNENIAEEVPTRSLSERLKDSDLDSAIKAMVELDGKTNDADFSQQVTTEIANTIANLYWDKKSNKRIKTMALHILWKAKQFDAAKPLAEDAIKNHKELKFMADAILNHKE